MADKADERAVEPADPEDTRRVEEALRRHGIDPARAVEQRNWGEQGNTLRRLLDLAGELLPADEYRRLQAEIGRG
ncbi:MAG TPA: hypothetical protein VE993_17110 [Stellaceae bacterium]|nr:hypothetical protein [Stellaceae bacterium]